jgi:hypothetical protein
VTDNSISIIPEARTVRAISFPSPDQFHAMMEFADALAKSGVLPAHIKTGAAALAIMQRGAELGIPQMQALTGMYFISGKLVMDATLVLSLIYRDLGPSALEITESTEERCAVVARRSGWAQAQGLEFTIEDAKRADLLKNPTWQKYPQAMLRARAITAAARAFFPDVLGGSVYYPGETTGDVVDLRLDAQPDGTARATPKRAPTPQRQHHPGSDAEPAAEPEAPVAPPDPAQIAAALMARSRQVCAEAEDAHADAPEAAASTAHLAISDALVNVAESRWKAVLQMGVRGADQIGPLANGDIAVINGWMKEPKRTRAIFAAVASEYDAQQA